MSEQAKAETAYAAYQKHFMLCLDCGVESGVQIYIERHGAGFRRVEKTYCAQCAQDHECMLQWREATA